MRLRVPVSARRSYRPYRCSSSGRCYHRALKLMKATILHAGGDLRHETVPDPSPKSNEAIVEVHACSICGSDVHAFHGKHPRLTFPRILGHEFAGRIVAIGSALEGFRVGERVCCDIDFACGTCGPCADGRSNICENLRTMGFDRDG